MPPQAPNRTRLRISSYLPYDIPDFVGGMLSVLALAGLSSAVSVNDTTLDDGALVWVESRKRYYMLDKLATDAVLDGEIVATASGTGRFFSLNWTSSQHWALQSQWAISAATGSDDNDGSNATPLKTYQEYIRRVPRYFVSQAIQIVDTLPDSDNLIHSPEVVWKQSVQGTMPTFIVTGTRTNGANLIVTNSANEVGNAAPTVTVAAAVWTEGQMLLITVGANAGATAVVTADLGAGAARTTPWRTVAGARTTPPGIGDTIVVLSAPTVNAVNVDIRKGNVSVAVVPTYQNLNIKSLQTVSGAFVFTCFIAGSQSITPQLGTTYLFSGCSITTSGAVGTTTIGTNLFRLCGIIRPTVGTILFAAGGRGEFSDCVIERWKLDVGNIGGALGFVQVASLGIFNGGAATTAVKVTRGGVIFVTGTLYGPDPGGASVGADVRENGHVYVNAANTPTLTAATELLFENAGTANAAPPLATGVIPAAAALTTWATWAGATFNRNVLSYSTGANIGNHA